MRRLPALPLLLLLFVLLGPAPAEGTEPDALSPEPQPAPWPVADVVPLVELRPSALVAIERVVAMPEEEPDESLDTVAQPPADDVDDDDEKKWRFTLTPYAWLLGIDGDVRVQDTRADVNQSFSDVLKKLSFVAEGRLEAYYGDWGFTADLTYGLLKDDSTTNGVKIDAETHMWLGTFAVNHKLVRGKWLGGERDYLVEASVGAILVDIDTDLSISGGIPDRRFEEGWVDVAGGARFTGELSENWSFRASGLLGGFGIGESAELSWGAEGLFGYQRDAESSWRFWAGYRALGLDYERSRYDLDIVIHGPILGATYRF